jgi:hypothetical protein
MTLFSDILGTNRYEDIVTLAKKETSDKTAPTTVQAPYPQEVKRIASSDLELCYIFDPIIFNAINKNVQTIMAAGHRISCKDKKVEDYFVNEFIPNIGQVGEDITWNELLEVSFQNLMIYGRHYIETVLNVYRTDVLDLVSLDPKLMDYARDSMRRIVVDKYGKPIGYTQNLPYGVDITGKGDPVPEGSGVVLINRQIFILPERIAYFKLYTYGNRFDGLGLIEPAYQSIVRKQNIEEAQANSIYARGTYPIVDYVGNENHFPTPNMIKSASEKLSEMAHNRYFALPYWHKLEPIEVKQSEVVDNTMKWLRESASASLGMPMAFATGSGEATNRATLGTLQKFMEFSLKDIVGRVCAQMKQHVFRRICAYKGFKEIPDLIWGDIGAESVDDKAMRLQNYVKVGALDPKIVETFALESEKLNLSTTQRRKDNYEENVVKDGEKGDKKVADEPYQIWGANKPNPPQVRSKTVEKDRSTPNAG